MTDEVAPSETGRDQAKLEKQLERLRIRLIYRAFNPLYTNDPLDLDTLFPIVKTLESTKWDGNAQDKTEALQNVINDAIGLLPGREEVADYIPDTTITWRKAARLLYNLVPRKELTASIRRQIDDARRKVGASWDKESEELVAWLMVIGNINESFTYVVDTIIPKLRKMLALRLLELEEVHLTPEESEFEPGYVPRKALQKEVRDAFKRGNRVVLLHGDAGTGKSRLARGVACLEMRSHEHIGDLVIEAKTERALAASVDRFMEMHAPDVDVANSDRLQRKFQDLLTGDEAPPIVILDNVPDADTLESLLPAQSRRLVIVTSRDNFESDRIQQVIPVKNMEEGEAYSLVAQEAPDIAPEDIPLLAIALDYRPLAIVHGCACVRDKDSYDNDVSEFCGALPSSLDDFYKRGEATLNTIYKITIDQLSRDQYSDTILELLDIVLIYGPIFVDFLEFAPLVFSSLHEATGTQVTKQDRARFKKARQILEDRSLIWPSEFSVMHDLTAQILVGIRAKTLATSSVERSVKHLLERVDLESWPGGFPLPFSWPLMPIQIANLFTTLMVLSRPESLYSESAPIAVLDCLLGVMLRQTREISRLSAHMRDQVSLFVIFGLKYSELTWSPLRLEALELGYLDYATGRHDGQSLTDEVIARDSDLHIYAAPAASFLHPLTRDASIVAVDSISNPTYADMIAEFVGWRPEFAFRFYLGVVSLESAQWTYAREWLESCLELCDSVKELHPEVVSIEMSCAQRLLEVALFSNDRDLADKYLSYAASQLREFMDAGPNSRIDRYSATRLLQLTQTVTLEYALKSRGAFYRDPGQVAFSQLLEISQLLKSWDLELFASECQFHVLRATVIAGDDHDLATVSDHYLRLSEWCMRRGYSVGEAIFRLSTIKLMLMVAEQDQLPDVLNSAFIFIPKIASVLADTHSYYWQADALNVMYAAELLANESNERIDNSREAAREALVRINREDKLQWAEAVIKNRRLSVLLFIL